MPETSNWVGVTAAISLVIIAASFAAIAIAVVLAARRVSATLKSLGKKLDTVREAIDPALKTINNVAAKAEVASEKAVTEFDSILDTSRQLRWRVVKGANRVEQRLTDLDALYEVVSTEVENTALDVASMVRTVRSGTSVMGRIRRMLLPRRR